MTYKEKLEILNRYHAELSGLFRDGWIVCVHVQTQTVSIWHRDWSLDSVEFNKDSEIVRTSPSLEEERVIEAKEIFKEWLEHEEKTK